MMPDADEPTGYATPGGVAPPKHGLFVTELSIDPTKPLVFDLDQLPADAELVGAWMKVREDGGRIIGGQRKVLLCPVLTWLIKVDAPRAVRRIVLLGAGGYTDDGAWEGAWIAEPDFVHWRTFPNPVDGSPISVLEIPIRDDHGPVEEPTDGPPPELVALVANAGL